MSVYLDHAATSPMRPEVLAAYVEALGVVGNPSSIHCQRPGGARLLETGREQVAASLGADAVEVVLHRRRHRGGQPRHQGPVLGAQDSGSSSREAAYRDPASSSRWPSTTPPSTPSSGSPPTRARSSTGSRSTSWAASASTPSRPRSPSAATRSRWSPRSGRTTRSARSSRSPTSSRSRRATACPCTSTRSPPTARCRSTSAPIRAPARALDLRPQDRRTGRHRRARSSRARRPSSRCCTAATSSAPAPEPRMPPGAVAFGLAAELAAAELPSTPRGWRACATGWWPASARPSRVPCSARTTPRCRGPPARQRALHLRRLRGRLAAVPARRGGLLGVDRLRLPGRRAGGVARAARDGPVGGRRARRPALHPRERHHGIRHRRPARGAPRRRRPGPHRRPRRPHPDPRPLTRYSSSSYWMIRGDAWMQSIRRRPSPMLVNLCGGLGRDRRDRVISRLELLAVDDEQHAPIDDDPRLGVRMPVQPGALPGVVVDVEERGAGPVVLALESRGARAGVDRHQRAGLQKFDHDSIVTPFPHLAQRLCRIAARNRVGARSAPRDPWPPRAMGRADPAQPLEPGAQASRGDRLSDTLDPCEFWQR